MKALLPEYVLGTLAPAEHAQVARALESSPALRDEAGELTLALASLADSLAPIPPPPPLRARVLASLALPALQPDWRPAAAALVASVALVTIAVAAGVAALNWPVGNLIVERAPALALLLFAQMTGLWAARAPGPSRWAPVSWAAALGGAVAVLAARSAEGTGSLPGWVCAASQLLVGLAPLALVARALRGAGWRRGLTAGVALGTAGALWGQIACERSMLHVAVHHGGVWLLMIAACALAQRSAPYGKMPRSP